MTVECHSFLFDFRAPCRLQDCFQHVWCRWEWNGRQKRVLGGTNLVLRVRCNKMHLIWYVTFCIVTYNLFNSWRKFSVRKRTERKSLKMCKDLTCRYVLFSAVVEATVINIFYINNWLNCCVWCKRGCWLLRVLLSTLKSPSFSSLFCSWWAKRRVDIWPEWMLMLLYVC